MELNADAIRFHVLRHVRMVRHLAMVFGVDIDFDAKAFLNDTEKCKEKPGKAICCTLQEYGAVIYNTPIFLSQTQVFRRFSQSTEQQTSLTHIGRTVLQHNLTNSGTN